MDINARADQPPESQERQEQPVALDEARQARAREYSRLRLRYSLINMVIGLLVVILLFYIAVRGWLSAILHPLSWQPVAGWFPLQVLVYFLILMLLYQLAVAPMVFVSTYILPRRYGLSVMRFASWLRDTYLSLALALVMGIVMLEIVYFLLATQPLAWWLWVALILLFFTVIMANLGPVLLFPLFYTYRPMPEGDLMRRLLALADRAHTHVRGVYTFDMSRKTTAANAALMGLGNTRRIVIGDTLLKEFSDDEIEVILAHELGHHVHNHIWKSIILQSLLTLGGLYVANLIFHWIVEARHYQGLSDPATLPLLVVLAVLFGLIVMPLNNAFSRHIEYQADEYALQSTRMIEPFKSAMARLANQNLSQAEPSPIVEFLLYTHPSTSKRLLHADAFAKAIS